jgi:sugar lactone lactonase YvrE
MFGLLLAVAVLTSIPMRSFAQDAAMPEVVTVERKALYPEGIAYDANGKQFLVSSIAEGTIHAVTDDGKISPFIEDKDLISTIGLHIDASRNRLLVANSDPGLGLHTDAKTQGKLAALSIYDLATRKRLNYVDLGALLPENGHVANDMTVDTAGNIYVTDSFAPVIYRVDSKGQPSVLVQDKQFAGEGFGLNGIIFHPDGYLIVSKSNDGLLFRVPLDNPKAVAPIKVERKFLGADGMVLQADGSLVLITNALGSTEATNSVVVLKSSDKWQSANVAAEQSMKQNPPTTGTVRNSNIYVIFGAMDKLLDPKNQTPAATFEIRRASFSR